MKKGLILLLFVFAVVISKAQVFNTSSILKKGEVAIGFEPSLIVFDGENDFMTFFHGGIGLSNNIDLGVKVGAFGERNYYGADIEFGVSKELSLSVGMHDFYDFAVDATANVSIPLVGGTKLITGLDMDYFVDHSSVAVWIPLGMRVNIGNGWSVIMESEIELTDRAYHYFGFGMAYGF